MDVFAMGVLGAVCVVVVVFFCKKKKQHFKENNTFVHILRLKLFCAQAGVLVFSHHMGWCAAGSLDGGGGWREGVESFVLGWGDDTKNLLSCRFTRLFMCCGGVWY